MSCKQCGFNFGSHANFCPACGKKVLNEEQDTKSSSELIVKRLKLIVLAIFIGISILLSLILFSHDITDIVPNQLDAIKERQWKKAYENYTSQAFQKTISLNRFIEFMSANIALSNYESIRYIDRNSDHNSGSLQAMVLTTQGNEIPVFYEFIKENGQWKISHIEALEKGDVANLTANAEIDFPIILEEE